MFAIYLVNRVSHVRGYFKDIKGKHDIIEGVDYRYNKPILTQSPEKTYKGYVNAEKKCHLLPDQIKRFCSNGMRNGWDWRNMYDIYIIDLSNNKSKKIVKADIKDESPLREDVRLGLHGYY